MAFEQRKRNRIPLGNVSCIVDVQMISAVVSRQQLRGVAWVAHDFVEIDHSVEFAAAADPGVDLLTNLFILGSVKADRGLTEGRVLKRRDRRPYDSNSLFVGAGKSYCFCSTTTLLQYCPLVGAHAG